MPLRPPNECCSFPLFSFFFWENEATCLLPKTYTLQLFCWKNLSSSLSYAQAFLVLPFHFTQCRVKHTSKEMQPAIKISSLSFSHLQDSQNYLWGAETCKVLILHPANMHVFIEILKCQWVKRKTWVPGSWKFRWGYFFFLPCCLLWDFNSETDARVFLSSLGVGHPQTLEGLRFYVSVSHL